LQDQSISAQKNTFALDPGWGSLKKAKKVWPPKTTTGRLKTKNFAVYAMDITIGHCVLYHLITTVQLSA